MGFTSRGSPSPQRMGFASREFPSPKRTGFASRESPYPMRMRVASRGSPPLQCEWDSLQGGPLLQSEWDSLQGIPPLHSDSVSLQGTLLHLDISTHPVLRLRITPLRDPICGLLLPSIFPSKGDKEADESSLTAPVKAMIDFILKSFPDAQKSPYHPSSRSFEELQTLRFPRDRFWPSALRCQMPSLTLNRDSLIALRMEGYAILCCLLSTSSRRSPVRLLKEVS